jgi:hypothetical protein
VMPVKRLGCPVVTLLRVAQSGRAAGAEHKMPGGQEKCAYRGEQS